MAQTAIADGRPDPIQLRRELLELKEERRNRLKYRRFDYMFPDTGPLRRELYKTAVEFFAAGATYNERVLFGGNRTGKTETGGFEVACHTTGLYPSWWTGKRFSGPTTGVVAGKDRTTVRDTIQVKLIGKPLKEFGTGLIPRDLIVWEECKSSGLPNAYETIAVRHVSGGISIINCKSYDMGREAFEGTARHFVWEDEESTPGIHSENVARVFDTNGVVFNTYTPLKGQTELTLDLIRRSQGPDADVWRGAVTWWDAPHISEEKIKSFYKKYPPHELKARAFGIPKLGSGAVFPVEFDEFKFSPMEIPDHWPRAYGMDFGWDPDPTAVVWGAWDRDTDTIYLYSEHYRTKTTPADHVRAIEARGKWIHGNSETAGTNPHDGKRLIDTYKTMGLHLHPADKAVESGLLKMRDRIETGRLKVSTAMPRWREEFESYHRDEDGKLARRQQDHLMDATRYLIMAPPGIWKTRPPARRTGQVPQMDFGLGI